MYFIITNTGEYRCLPHAKSVKEAELEMHLIYTNEEIRELEAEIISDTEN